MIHYIIAAGIGAFLGSQSKKSKKSYAEGGEIKESSSQFKKRSEKDSVRIYNAWKKVLDSNFGDKEYQKFEKLVKDTQIPQDRVEKITNYTSTTPRGKQKLIDIYQYWGKSEYAKGGEVLVVKTKKGLKTMKDFEDFSKDEIKEWGTERGLKYNAKGEKFGGQALKVDEFFVKPRSRYNVKLPSSTYAEGGISYVNDDFPELVDSQTYVIDGTYGSNQNPTEVYVMELEGGGKWYAARDSVNVNYTNDSFYDGVDIETISDIDTITASKPIEYSDDLEDLIVRHYGEMLEERGDDYYAKGGSTYADGGKLKHSVGWGIPTYYTEKEIDEIIKKYGINSMTYKSITLPKNFNWKKAELLRMQNPTELERDGNSWLERNGYDAKKYGLAPNPNYGKNPILLKDAYGLDDEGYFQLLSMYERTPKTIQELKEFI